MVNILVAKLLMSNGDRDYWLEFACDFFCLIC